MNNDGSVNTSTETNAVFGIAEVGMQGLLVVTF